MDELDGIPLFRGGVQFGSVPDSSDSVFSQLRRSSDELLDYLCLRWYILEVHIFCWCVLMIVYMQYRFTRTPFPEGHWIAPRRHAKCSMITSDGDIEIMLGSCTIHVPKSSNAHNPVLQMVRFGQYLCGVAYPYPYPMVPKYILRSRPPTSRHACEAYLDSARHKSESRNAATSEAVQMESSGHIKPEHHSAPTDSCDNAEQHCCAMKVEPIVADSSLVASAAPNLATWNCSLLYDVMMRRKMLVFKMSISNDRKGYWSQINASSEHKDENAGAARALSDLQREENMLVVKKELADTKPEHPSESDTGCTIKTDERKATATWLIATAAPHHATGDCSLLSGFTPEDSLFVEAGDGSPMQALGHGSVVTDTVVLPSVWFVPGLTANLVSVSKLVELDYSVGFARAVCYIRSAADGAVIGKAHAGEDGMFELDFLRVPPPDF